MSVHRYPVLRRDRRRRDVKALVAAAAMVCGGLAGCGSVHDSSPLAAQLDLAAVAPGDQQFCATVTKQMSALPSKPTGDSAGDAATLGANFAELAAIAPPEIRPDLQTLADTFQGGGSDGGAGTSPMSALHHYVDYLSNHCGIEVPLGNAPTTTTGS